MSLSSIAREAQRKAVNGDSKGAEACLAAAIGLIDAENDPDALRQYAQACHYWGPPEAEEAALRACLRQGRSLDLYERLLDLLQQELNAATGDVHAKRLTECIDLGTEALCLIGDEAGPAWANLIRARGLRHLGMARLGHVSHAAKARSDIEAYLSWLQMNRSVPRNFQRNTMMALAELDLGELLILEGHRYDAARTIERAIEAIEAAGLLNGKWTAPMRFWRRRSIEQDALAK